MASYELVVEQAPDAGDIRFLEDRINEFNIATTGFPFDGSLAIFVRNGQGAIVAGITGWFWGGCCDIRSLWVHEQFRGQGYGSQLLQAAEREATARGCQVITLDTHSFQAPTFYTKFGYTIVGVVDGYPRGYQKLFLRKELNG